VGFVVERAVRSLRTVQSLSLRYHCTNVSYTLVFPFSATDALQLTQPVTTSLRTAPRVIHSAQRVNIYLKALLPSCDRCMNY
jgi:hypothetical protein